MKSSRAMLLAAMLFVAPVFADEADQVQDTNTQIAQDAPKAPEAEPKKEEAPKTEGAKEEAPKAEDKKEEAKTETPKAEDKKEEVKQEVKKEEAKAESWFAAKLAVLTGFGTTVANYTVTPVAEWTTIPALKQLLRISYLKGGKFETNLPVIGKSMVVVAAAGAAIAAYNAMNQQEEDADETMFE